jgi:hypothetical protein
LRGGGPAFSNCVAVTFEPTISCEVVTAEVATTPASKTKLKNNQRFFIFSISSANLRESSRIEFHSRSFAFFADRNYFPIFLK